MESIVEQVSFPERSKQKWEFVDHLVSQYIGLIPD